MKQSEMSQRIDRENPVCISQIHTGKQGKLTDVSILASQWRDYRKARSSKYKRIITLRPDGITKLQRDWRLGQWTVKGIWHRTVQSFKLVGKFIRFGRTGNMQGNPQTKVKQFST